MLWQSMVLLAQDAAPVDGAGEGGGGAASLLPLLPWIAIGVLFYLMLLRPERRKRAEMDQMLDLARKGIGEIIALQKQAARQQAG